MSARDGLLLGRGVEVAVSADCMMAEAHIILSGAEPVVGIIPGWSGTQRSVQRFGAQITRRMALAGEAFRAEAALMLGMVDKVVAKGESLNAAIELAEVIIKRSVFATSAVKMMINAADGEDGPRAIEALGGIAVAHSAELKAGLAAFNAKKKL